MTPVAQVTSNVPGILCSRCQKEEKGVTWIDLSNKVVSATAELVQTLVITGTVATIAALYLPHTVRVMPLHNFNYYQPHFWYY